MVTSIKKTALAVLALGVSGVAAAQVYMPPPDLPPPPVVVQTEPTKHGMYFGLGVGAIGLDDQMTTTGTTDLTVLSHSQSSTTTMNGGDIGVNGTAIIGYSWKTPNRFFMGAEIFGDYMNPSASKTTTNTNTQGSDTGTLTDEPSMDLKYVYGARALPGYQATQDTVIYGIVGYARAHTTTDLTVTGTGTTPSATGSETTSASDSFNLNGYQLGVGSMIEVSSHLALRGDLIYTGYDSATLRTGTKSDANGSVSGTVESQPSTLEADVALVLTFD